MEGVSGLANKTSYLFGYRLTKKQQIQIHFIIPGICFIIIFVLNFSLDIGIGIALLNENRKLYGLATISLMYVPVFVCYLQRLFQPPSPSNCATVISWIIKETACFIFFPYWIIKSLGVQLFWIIEIITEKENHEEPLLSYEECFSEHMENYLFFQILFQNIPQAILQLHMLTIGVSTYDETDVFQAFCTVVSLLMAAANIVRLHRYESQRIGGRTPIWKVPPPPIPTPTPSVTEQNTTLNPLLAKQSTELRLPVRRPRLKALEEDNPIGKLFLFFFWSTFLLARTVALTTAAHFYPRIIISIVSGHALIMLIYYAWYNIPIYQKLFLTITSIFFIFEVGIKIQKIGYLYLLFIVTTLVEDIGSTILWYIWGNWSGWWYNYVVYVDINSHILMLIFFAIYLAFFKPKVKYVRTDQNTSNRSSVANS